MTKTPRATIIIPTFNRAGVITRAIDSVLQQSYQSFELIVIDDGSTDETGTLVKEYAVQYPEKVCYCYHTHRSVSHARNRGIQLANGDYIAFLDSDDSWHPRKLEKQVAYLEHQDVGLVHTGRRVYASEDYKRLGLLPAFDQLARSSAELLSGCSGLAMSVLIRREVFKKVGQYDESLPTTQDLDLWLRIAKEFEIGLIDEPLLNSFKRGDSLGASDLELKYRNRATVYRRMSHDHHPMIRNAVWKKRLIQNNNALAAEKLKKRNSQECF